MLLFHMLFTVTDDLSKHTPRTHITHTHTHLQTKYTRTSPRSSVEKNGCKNEPQTVKSKTGGKTHAQCNIQRVTLFSSGCILSKHNNSLSLLACSALNDTGIIPYALRALLFLLSLSLCSLLYFEAIRFGELQIMQNQPQS